MKDAGKAEDRLRKVLAGAYLEKAVRLDGMWRTRVMEDIRRLGPLQESPGSGWWVPDRFVWRFAAAAAAVVLILGGLALKDGFAPEFEMTRTFYDQPLDYTEIYLEPA